MKPEEINKAIAESLGWKDVRTMISSKHINPFAFGINTDLQSEIVPNYAESLDACSEFERTITERSDCVEYLIQLDSILGKFDFEWQGEMKRIKASPAQRCEAYMRMKGLWGAEKK